MGLRKHFRRCFVLVFGFDFEFEPIAHARALRNDARERRGIKGHDGVAFSLERNRRDGFGAERAGNAWTAGARTSGRSNSISAASGSLPGALGAGTLALGTAGAGAGALAGVLETAGALGIGALAATGVAVRLGTSARAL